MRRVFILGLLLSVFQLFSLSAFLFAQPQQSENFRITKSVIDAGGAAGASTDFRLYSAFGQSTPVGAQSSEDFLLYAGYLSPSLAVHPLSPIQDLVIHIVPPDARLHWNPVVGAERYKVFRNTVAGFAPSPSDLIATVADTFFVDVNACTLLPGLTYFYCVEASNTPHPLTAEPPVSPLRKGVSAEPFSRKRN